MTVASGDVGIYIADKEEICCFCDESLAKGTLVKSIGARYASIPCVEKALAWMLNAREKKKDQGK